MSYTLVGGIRQPEHIYDWGLHPWELRLNQDSLCHFIRENLHLESAIKHHLERGKMASAHSGRDS